MRILIAFAFIVQSVFAQGHPEAAGEGILFRVNQLTTAIEQALVYDRRDWIEPLGETALAFSKEVEFQAFQKKAELNPSSPEGKALKRFNDAFTRTAHFHTLSEEIEGNCGPKGFENLSGIVVDELRTSPVKVCISPGKVPYQSLDDIQAVINSNALDKMMDASSPSVPVEGKTGAFVTPKYDFYFKTLKEARLNTLKTAMFLSSAQATKGFSVQVQESLIRVCGVDKACQAELKYPAETFALQNQKSKLPKGQAHIAAFLRGRMTQLKSLLMQINKFIKMESKSVATFDGGHSSELRVSYSFTDEAAAQKLFAQYNALYADTVKQGNGNLLFTDALDAFEDYTKQREFSAKALSNIGYNLRDPAKLTDQEVGEALAEAQEGVALHAKETLDIRDIDSLIEGNPTAVAQVLMDHPEYSQYACSALTRIQQAAKSWDKKKKVLLWGGVIVGAVLTGGALGAAAVGAIGVGTAIATAGTVIGLANLPTDIYIAVDDYRQSQFLQGRAIAESRVEDFVAADDKYTEFLWDTGGAVANVAFLGVDGWMALKTIGRTAGTATKGFDDVLKLTPKAGKEVLELADSRKVVNALESAMKKNGDAVTRRGDELIIDPKGLVDDAGPLNHLAGVFQDPSMSGLVNQIKVSPRKFWNNTKQVAHYDPDTKTLYVTREWFENTAEAAAKRKEFISGMLSCSS